MESVAKACLFKYNAAVPRSALKFTGCSVAEWIASSFAPCLLGGWPLFGQNMSCRLVSSWAGRWVPADLRALLFCELVPFWVASGNGRESEPVHVESASCQELGWTPLSNVMFGC